PLAIVLLIHAELLHQATRAINEIGLALPTHHRPPHAVAVEPFHRDPTGGWQTHELARDGAGIATRGAIERHNDSRERGVGDRVVGASGAGALAAVDR